MLSSGVEGLELSSTGCDQFGTSVGERADRASKQGVRSMGGDH